MDNVYLYIITASALSVVSSLPARTFYFVYDFKTWTEAQSYCRENYKDLVTIEDMKDVDILNNMKNLSRMVYSSYSYRAWNGLYDDVNSWKWSMSDSNFYQQNEKKFRKWDSGQPDNAGGRESCVGMYSTGFWNDENCSTGKTLICFNINGLVVTFVYINTFMNWTEAQSYCREHHTDLVSVRNQAENQKVVGLIPAGQSVWIGLYRDTWKWSDGSSASFRYWKGVEPNGNTDNCAASFFGQSGGWEDWPCATKMAFICYEVPVSKHMVKLKLMKPSSVDLNEPAVLENLLKQLNQKLKDQGVKGDIKLSWKKQPDGNIFSKETEEEKKPNDSS